METTPPQKPPSSTACPRFLTLNPMLRVAISLQWTFISWLPSHPSQHLHFTETIHSGMLCRNEVLFLTTYLPQTVKPALEISRKPAAAECAVPAFSAFLALQLERNSGWVAGITNSIWIAIFVVGKVQRKVCTRWRGPRRNLNLRGRERLEVAGEVWGSGVECP